MRPWFGLQGIGAEVEEEAADSVAFDTEGSDALGRVGLQRGECDATAREGAVDFDFNGRKEESSASQAGWRVCRTTFLGPYEQLPGAWQRLTQAWLPQSGYRPRETPGFEIYRNTPGEVSDDQLVTELCLAIE